MYHAKDTQQIHYDNYEKRQNLPKYGQQAYKTSNPTSNDSSCDKNNTR